MYNQNNNMWSAITPLVSQPFGYSSSLTRMPINTTVLLQNQQNSNHLVPYYNQNQVFGQHLAQYNNNYNYYRPSLPLQPSNPSTNSSYLLQTQQNHTFAANPLTQTYSLNHQKPIQSLATNQTPINSNQSVVNTYQNLNQLNANACNDSKWLELLNPNQKQVLDQLNKETEEFELQFRNWEKDFENWKTQNVSHPDISAYQLYVNQWQDWRQRLVDRQTQMKELRNRTLQQLYSQVNQQSIETQRIGGLNPPPPPSVSARVPEVAPPLPPLPPKDNSIPPPPPPNDLNSQNTSSFLNSQNILEIKKNMNLTENDLNVNLEEIQMNRIEQNLDHLVNHDSNDSIEILKANKSDNSIEVIEIDCETDRTTDRTDKSVSNSETKTDSTAISKAAEAILFIQKQQELLKSLDNFKNVKTSDSTNDDLQVIDGPKPFDIKEIVTKMKAIRPPDNPIQAKVISDLPSLQGIVFSQTPNFNNHSIRGQINEPYRQRFANNPNPLSAPDYRMQSIRHQMPFNSLQRPQFPIEPINSSNRPTMSPHLANSNRNFQLFCETQWNNNNNNNNSNNSSKSDYYYRMSDSLSIPQPNNTNTVRKYSAQTIDYNHRHENSKEFNAINEPIVESQALYTRKPVQQLNKDFNNEVNEHFNIQRDNNYNLRKPFNSPEKVIPLAEETTTYRDLHHFTQPKNRIVSTDDLLKPPAREFRPENIVIILRGLPGSGKTFIAKVIKEKELEFGGSAPRILSIDDYFMAEVERETKDSETGKRSKTKEFVYEYESEMESCYRASLLKTYKKTIDDRLFPFIIIDAVNELIGDIEDFYSYAIKNAFVVYVLEMESKDPLVCHQNNIHNRKLEDIKQIHKKWQILPDFMLRLDSQLLLQNSLTQNIEVESNATKSTETLKRRSELESDLCEKKSKPSLDFEDNTQSSLSRWERLEASEEKLDKLDSFKMKTKPTIDEYLQVTDDYELRPKDGHKRVRWADIEEKKKVEHMRKIGFVMGLDWHQYMDPQHCERALTKTEYF